MDINKKSEIAVFGGGCFWCTEAVFQKLKGVKSVMPGYAGGPSTRASSEPQSNSSPQEAKERAPTYEEVCSGKTGHAEVIKVEFDPKEISYRDLLTVFFASHDPTTRNRQGNDIGTQYRSVIFYTSEEQKREAKDFVKELNDPVSKPVVTELTPLDKFYPAEDYHRNYYKENKSRAYCQIVINPKLEKLKEKYENLLKQSEK